jgi:hypothetical protein
MEQKIQLIHPQGKKAISMDKGKYDIIRMYLLKYLKSKKEVTHAEIQNAISEEFKRNKIKFEGSLEWYTEWVKLDLEARKEIKREGAKAPYKFSIFR